MKRVQKGTWARNKPLICRSDEDLIEGKTDAFLRRLAWISQIVLVIGASVGYFLTVRPVYQKELLDEQIAERTVQLREATAAVARMEAEAKRLQIDNKSLSTEANTSYTRLLFNLKSNVSDAAYSCVGSEKIDLLNGERTWNCVSNYINRHVIAYLRQADKEKLTVALAAQREAIKKLPQRVAIVQTQKLRKARRDLAQYEAEIESIKATIVRDINRIRSEQGYTGEPLRTYKDLTELRSRAEQLIYDPLFKQIRDLEIKRLAALNAKSDAEIDVEFDIQSALKDLLNRVAKALD